MTDRGANFEQFVDEVRRRGHGPTQEDLSIWRTIVNDPIAFWTLRTLAGDVVDEMPRLLAEERDLVVTVARAIEEFARHGWPASFRMPIPAVKEALRVHDSGAPWTHVEQVLHDGWSESASLDRLAVRVGAMGVGAGPANLAWHVYFKHYKNAKELSYALAPIFNAEMKDLVAAGAKYLQFEDLGAWLPLFTGDKNDYTWIKDVVAQCCDGVDAKIGWHFCFGNAWGNDILSANFPEGYQTVLPHLFDTPGIDQFVLDYANRNMAGVDFLKNLPKDKDIQIGVLDIRTSMIEKPAAVADRIRQVIKYVSPDRVTPSTDCGMKPLARTVAKLKLKSLAEGAAIVRKEVGA
jgi:methionine synthase II (cobalamin-independent)